MNRTILTLILGMISVMFAACSEETEELLGPANGDEEEDINTWIWALDDDAGQVRVYDADDGMLKATLSAVSHPFMRQAKAGPVEEPTVWMGKNGFAYGFTRGFHPHGDHAHMELPESLTTVVTGADNVHQGVDPHGDYLIYANDGDQNFTIVDVDALASWTVPNGSGHSAALMTDDYIVATQMSPGWIRFLDITTGDIEAEFSIPENAHGDAFHHDSETAFIATDAGFVVLDVEAPTVADTIAYPNGINRVNFLYHGSDSPVAFAPHKAAGTGVNSDKIVLLDMENRTTEAITISGAELTWNIGGGNFALSDNGNFVLATDVSDAEAYLICIDSGNVTCYRTVTTWDVPAADMACAINFNGDHVWMLNKATGEVYCYHPDEGELHNQWQAAATTDYIFATSYDGDIIKDYE
jgi:hypothetical protein